MKVRIRLIGLVFAALLSVLVFAAASFADTQPWTPWDSKVQGLAVLDSGTCGANLKWEVRSGGYMIISGTGAMYDYGAGQPWIKYEDSVKHLLIDVGVTELSQGAFYDFHVLEDVYFSQTVNTVWNAAFHNCYMLRTIVFTGSMPDLVYPFGNVEAKVYYPDTWTEVPAPGDYGRALTWVSYPVSSLPAKYRTQPAEVPSGSQNTDSGSKDSQDTASGSGDSQDADLGGDDSQDTNAKWAAEPVGKTLTYNGKNRTGVSSGTGYTLSGKLRAVKAGTYTAIASLKSGYVWPDGSTEDRRVTWKIKKAANPLSVKARLATLRFSKLKKKAQALSVGKLISFKKKGQGKLTYVKKSGNKKITVNRSTGKITVKKGLKKGTYKVTIKIKAAGNANYKASGWKVVTVRVRVK